VDDSERDLCVIYPAHSAANLLLFTHIDHYKQFSQEEPGRTATAHTQTTAKDVRISKLRAKDKTKVKRQTAKRQKRVDAPHVKHIHIRELMTRTWSVIGA